jgi:hypothetical protein
MENHRKNLGHPGIAGVSINIFFDQISKLSMIQIL